MTEEVAVRWEMVGGGPGLNSTAITDAPTLAMTVRPYLLRQTSEMLVAVFLDPTNKVLGVARVGHGSHHEAALDTYLLVRAAVFTNAFGFLVAHNHPSGAARPSEPDKILTQRLRLLGDALGCQLIDHLIMSADGKQWFSFNAEGML